MNKQAIARELVRLAKELVAADTYYHVEIEEDSIDADDMESLAERVLRSSDFGVDGWTVYSDDKSALNNFVRKLKSKGAEVGRVEKAPSNLYPL